MFHIFFVNSHLVSITLIGFFILFLLRHLLIKRKLFIVLYHVILGSILFVAAIGGGSVQNDGYTRLKQFIELEKNHKLMDAKQNPQHYDPMLSIDLKEFKNSDEFRTYLKRNDTRVDNAEAVSLGWLFVFLSDVAFLCLYMFRYTLHLLRNTLLLRRSS